MDDIPGLVIRRFDRVDMGGQPRSLAVEDACQLAGRYPADKYRLSAEDVTLAISSACPARAVAARNCFQQFVFAWLTGNGDLHAKNISILQEPDGEWQVAPIYDVPSTLPYGDHSMALTLAGRRENLTRRAFLTFAEAIGLRERAARSALDEVLDITAGLAEGIAAGVLPFNDNLNRNLARHLARRRRDLMAD